MAARFKKPSQRKPHFIKQWRDFRGLTQDQLAERIGIGKSTLSKIENFKYPYSQDFLEVCAEQLRCEPADLIMRDPTQPGAPWSIWEQIPPQERERAIEMLRLLTRTGT